MGNFKVTYFPSWIKTNDGEAKEYASFKAFTNALEKGYRKSGEKKDLPVFIMGKLDPPHRKNINVKKVGGFWGDIDNEYTATVDGKDKCLAAKHPIQQNEVILALRREGLSFVVYTTFNHMTGKTSCGELIPRLRVLIPYNRNCETGILKPTHQWFIELVSGLRPGVPTEELGIDASPEKPAQAPVVYASASSSKVESSFHFEDGESLDADYIIDNYSSSIAQKSASQMPALHTQDSRHSNVYTEPKINLEIFAKEINVQICNTSKDKDREGREITVYGLARCPLRQHEKNQKGAYFFLRTDDGEPRFYCHHNSCNGRYWADIKSKYHVELGELANTRKANSEKKILNLVDDLSPSSDTSEISAAIDLIAESELSPVQEEKFLQSIRTKTSTSIRVLREEIASREKPSLAKKSNEALVRRNLVNEVKLHFGEENIIFNDGFFLTWSERGVWRPICELEIEQIIFSKMPQGKDYQGNYIKDSIRALKASLYEKTSLNSVNGKLVVNVMNGELWLDDSVWELKKHDKSNFLTTQLPIIYDSSASARNWLLFKIAIFGDYRDVILEIAEALHSKGYSGSDLIKQLRLAFSGSSDEAINNRKRVFKLMIDCIRRCRALDELIGYSMLPTAQFEKLFFLQGSPGTGKSTFLKLIERILGKENISSVNPAEIGNRFNRIRVFGKLANISSEIEEGKIIPSDFLRALSSGDSIEGEKKGIDPISFEPYCTFIAACNDFPSVRDSSGAFMDRAIILKFNRSFRNPRNWPESFEKIFTNMPKRNTNLVEEKLIPELSGILNCGLKEIAKVFERNGQFTNTCIMFSRKRRMGFREQSSIEVFRRMLSAR